MVEANSAEVDPDADLATDSETAPDDQPADDAPVADVVDEKPVDRDDQFVPPAVDPQPATRFTNLDGRFLREIVPDVVAEQTTLDGEHYDKRSEREKMEQRREYLNNL